MCEFPLKMPHFEEVAQDRDYLAFTDFRLYQNKVMYQCGRSRDGSGIEKHQRRSVI